MNAPETILELINRFERNKLDYKKNSYNEAQLRKEFIDPFFSALGWDVNNEQGYAEAYKEVIHEDSLKIDSNIKSPDYCFRVGSNRKFFVEAKKPAISIKNDTKSAFQIRRYAWSANLPISILTDFEEFAVYDCRHKPSETDKASLSRVLYLTYEQYEDKWEDIYNTFSKDAIYKGHLDRFTEKNVTKKGYQEVDNDFLKEIELWRKKLACNIALRNNISEVELRFAVQQIIDRIIFLRICEDRGTEAYGNLKSLEKGENCYSRLFELFTKADQRYDSGLFHFNKEDGFPADIDSLTPNLIIDNNVIKDLIKNLYYPCPYVFSVIPIEILGKIYEQFLGKTITLPKPNRVKIEEKPEIKKSGGVFYTPKYIVESIIDNTLGVIIKDKSNKELEKIKVLDPVI